MSAAMSEIANLALAREAEKRKGRASRSAAGEPDLPDFPINAWVVSVSTHRFIGIYCLSARAGMRLLLFFRSLVFGHCLGGVGQPRSERKASADSMETSL